MVILRGEVYWVDFGGGVGVEIRKVRPAVVVSDDDHNACMATVTVAPLSSATWAVPPNEVSIPAGVFGDGRPGRVKTHQIRAADKRRFGKKMGEFPLGLMADVDASLRIHLGL
jgi:mRNA interferase MazF